VYRLAVEWDRLKTRDIQLVHTTSGTDRRYGSPEPTALPLSVPVASDVGISNLDSSTRCLCVTSVISYRV
jgi:hypothetical protein